MIQISNLEFGYLPGHPAILDQINLTINDGESVALMGANGSGKTTLVRCLNGLLNPVHGTVLIDGMSIGERENLAEIRRRVGIVFQNPENQFVSTTVEREIAFGLENLGVPLGEMRARVALILKQFNLSNLKLHPPHLLSGGEMQRLAVATVVAMSPSHIIFDEPTSLLDQPTRDLLLKLIEQIHLKFPKHTTLFVTQFPHETLCFRRILILHKGNFLFDGSPMDVFRNVEELNRIGISVPEEFDLANHIHKTFPDDPPLNLSDLLPITK